MNLSPTAPYVDRANKCAYSRKQIHYPQVEKLHRPSFSKRAVFRIVHSPEMIVVRPASHSAVTSCELIRVTFIAIYAAARSGPAAF